MHSSMPRRTEYIYFNEKHERKEKILPPKR